MIIKVRQDHIDQGKLRSSCECPISLAVSEQLGAESAATGKDMIQVRGGERGWSEPYTSPKCVQNFVQSFDKGGTPDPFSFELIGIDSIDDFIFPHGD